MGVPHYPANGDGLCKKALAVRVAKAGVGILHLRKICRVYSEAAADFLIPCKGKNIKELGS